MGNNFCLKWLNLPIDNFFYYIPNNFSFLILLILQSVIYLDHHTVGFQIHITIQTRCFKSHLIWWSASGHLKWFDPLYQVTVIIIYIYHLLTVETHLLGHLFNQKKYGLKKNKRKIKAQLHMLYIAYCF